MLRHVRDAALKLLDVEEDFLTGMSLEYSYTDLAASTGGFRLENRIGSGAAGTVYSGKLRGGTDVAVKVLDANPNGLDSFKEELRILSRFRHPNLVTLLGWGQHSENERKKYLVYELMAGGDVSCRLRRSQTKEEPFCWHHRVRVASDAGCGLSYMVNSNPKAFHRDVKPQNILLDLSGFAKMADFGLSATIKKLGQGHLTVNNISGTPGYADPVYIRSGKVTEQTEMFSFGTVLLELLLNERPAVVGPAGEVLYPLNQFVQPAAAGAHDRVLARLDPSGNWPTSSADEFARLALACTNCFDAVRPGFEEAVEKLRRLCNSPTVTPSSTRSVVTPSSTSSAPSWGQGPLRVPPHVRLAPSGGVEGRSHQVLPLSTGSIACAPTVEITRFRPQETGPNELSGDTIARSNPRPRPTPARSASGVHRQPVCPIMDVVLECIFAEGSDVSKLPPDARTVTIQLGKLAGEVISVGRQSQATFFESVMPRLDLLTRISRSHFELTRTRDSVNLCRTSSNPLALQGRPLDQNEIAALSHGDLISFAEPSANGDGHPYLEIRVWLRAAAIPAPACPSEKITHYLICDNAKGLETSLLRHVRLEECGIAIPPAGESLELGRNSHAALFESLLHVEPEYYGFISRSHFRIRQVTEKEKDLDGDFQVQIENLSGNLCLLDGRPLCRGQSGTLKVGGRISLVARDPNGSADSTCEFLGFTLWRACDYSDAVEDLRGTIVRL